MTELRKELPPLPERMKMLPLDHRGYPVPWFVAEVDGKPHFPTADTRKMRLAVQKRLCWVCGQPLGKFLAFVLGPMCTITRTTSEPPNHRECAEFAAIACPFLARPYMKRMVDEARPKDGRPAAGFHIDRNPGCSAVWITRSYRPFVPFAGAPGTLFKVGPPEEVSWYAEGRAATRQEVVESIEGGYPKLYELAQADGASAIAQLEAMRRTAEQLLPTP